MNRNAPMKIAVISSRNANPDGSLWPRCLYNLISVAMKKYVQYPTNGESTLTNVSVMIN
jgi:hypothetical protein